MHSINMGSAGSGLVVLVLVVALLAHSQPRPTRGGGDGARETPHGFTWCGQVCIEQGWCSAERESVVEWSGGVLVYILLLLWLCSARYEHLCRLLHCSGLYSSSHLLSSNFELVAWPSTAFLKCCVMASSAVSALGVPLAL